MDINDDHCNSSTREMVDENYLANECQSAELEEDNANCGGDDICLLNGVRQLHMHNADENYRLEDQELLGEVGFIDCEQFSYCGGNLNGILNSNRQNSEEQLAAGNSPPAAHYANCNKFAKFNKLAVLSEDLRISKILRRLMIETNRKAAIDLCKKLDAAVRNQTNASYICRSFDILFDNMITVIRQCPTEECLEHASVILGIMGYINRYNFVVYRNSLTKSYANNKNIRKYLMMALRTTLSCDSVNLDLKPYSERLLGQLKEYLENAEVTDFIAISETISELSKHYKQSFLRHFTDIVDIIVGWHLEIEQPTYLKRHCAKILQQFAEYFLEELDFTLGLLGQFIEDIEACCEEMLAEEVTMKSKQQTEARVGAFIGAFTSIIKAIVSKGVVLKHFTASTNIMSAKRVIHKVANQCFHVVALISQETIINLNEFYCVISSYDKSVENLCDLERIIELQLNHLSGFKENQVCSFLYMVLNVVRQYQTQLPLSFVSVIMNKDNVCLQELKLNCGLKTYRLLLRIYHEILNIKNVPLLQEAYRHILTDVNGTIGLLKNSHHCMYAVVRCELILSFYLAAISAMACQTSSIIGMYALNPSILELLITNCQAANESLWTKYPSLHQALLAVIIEHSTKNYNFRQSSRLLMQHQDSPTSENFSTILKFLANLLRWHVSPEILNWLEKLLEECKDDFAVLTEKDDFLEMCDNITSFAKKNPKVCPELLSSIVRYPKVPSYILSNIRDIALCALGTSDEHILASYCQLIASLPLQICISPDHDENLFYEDKERIISLFHWHKSTVCYNTLRPKYFKTFIESLEPHSDSNEWLYHTFTEKSFVHLHRENVSEYLNAVQENEQLLNLHMQYEAARYCVQQKLRTTIGKPQETFVAIEAIIMKYARFLTEKESIPDNLKTFDKVMAMQNKCRMLLGFLENLEKHIYNAAEGTAYAMLPAEKPAKTFFRVNASTCGEWFKRIRTAVNFIALHCMAPEMVIRYSEIILQSDTALTNQGYLDRTITSMAWALYSCRESDTLYGLLAWLKTKNCKGYEWVQYVAEHAAGQLEKAVVGYLSILNDDNLRNMDIFVREFIQKQLVECLYQTARWSEIPHITPDSAYSKQHLECMEVIYQNAISQSNSVENGAMTNALLKMTAWPDCQADKSSEKYDTFSYYEILHAVQKSCIARSVCNDDNTAVWFEPIKKCIHQGLRDSIMYSYEPGFNNNQLNELMLLNHVAQMIEQNANISISSNEINMPSVLLNKAMLWSLIMGNKSVKQHILLKMAASARLDNNLNYSQSLLERFFKLKGIDKSVTQIANDLKSNGRLYVDCNDLDVIGGVEELMKLQAQTSSTLDALEIGSACCVQIIERQSEILSTKINLPSSILNVLLTMSEWLTTHHRLHNNANLTNGEQFQNLQNRLPDIFCSHPDNKKSNILPPAEYAVGKLLNAACALSKECSGEAWFLFGNWCYRWGKKLMEASGGEQPSPDVKEIKLTNRNISSIQEILGNDFNDLNRIVELLNAHMVSAINDDNVEGVYANSQNTSELLENELKKICSLSEEQLSAIVSIWRQAHKGVYGFYEEATRAYFRYLAIQSDAVGTKKSNANISEVEDCTFVTTSLRLLRLIVKHAIGLQDVLEEGLRNTPLRPWKVIVPQLFSRLNHHEPYVRHSVSDLLCRLAVNQPQLIIFPAVVGAQQQELKQSSESADSQMQLGNCFVALLNSLAYQAPEMVQQVQLLVKELRRITLLWEEYWIHSLALLYAEYSHLYNALDAESKKFSSNAEIMLAKFEIFRVHLLSDFKQIVAVTTGKEPETNYERSFHERYKPHIEIVLNELQKSKEFAKPSEYWPKIKQLYNIFQQRPLRGNSSTIKISDISPVLANMRNTTIAMPGVDTYEKSAVYIKAVDSTVFILPTKTKPKKLTLCGSNGQNYTFLFKGQEDLHLDERIMQFLSISNSMMSRSYGSKSNTDCYKAHHYSVIPLGSQSGLISWVDNCTPLFVIYKKWQQRDAILRQQQRERRQSAKSHDQIPQSPTVANPSRPSELFYNKLTPLLAERNLKVTDPRKQWPMPVLKRVLHELSQETPKDLLAKEIWCYSINAADWRKSVRRYTISTAVMSIIGYIIGLGDRHLDNLIIKLGTGEIVHIDYNVCFEKGKSLRVPEKVPFRMTQNLKEALGVMGTEGTYRLACSHVLKVLRKERETLLTLLEAFVYDPLVDWTMSDYGSTTTSRGTSAHSAAVLITSLGSSREMQLSPKETFKCRKHDVDLSRHTLTLKIAEIRPACLRYKNDFDAQLQNIRQHIQNLLDLDQNILCLEQERDNFTNQLAMIRELEALGTARGSHALNTVTQRYNAYKRDLEAFGKIKQVVQQTIKDLDVVLKTYFDTLLRPSELNQIKVNPPNNDNDIRWANEFELVKDLLVGSNWEHLYKQAKYTRHEMDNSFIQTQYSAVECRDMLLFYSNVMRFYPRAKLRHNHLMRYKKAYADLIEPEDRSPNKCDSANAENDNSEGCGKTFDNIKMVYSDIHGHVTQAKFMLEEHMQQQQQQQVINDHSASALNDINDFISSNSQHNRQLVLISLTRRLELAFESFCLEQNAVSCSRDYFLLDQQLHFMQLVNKCVSCVNPSFNDSPESEILHLLVDSLNALRLFRDALEESCEQILSIFLMGESILLHKDLAAIDSFKMCPQFNAIYEESDKVLKKIVSALQKLKGKLIYLQEIQPNSVLDQIMNSWNINIGEYLQSCCHDVFMQLTLDLKVSALALRTNDANYVLDMRLIKRPIIDMISDVQSKFLDAILSSYVIQNIKLSISDLLSTVNFAEENGLAEAELLCDKLYVALERESLIQFDNLVVMHYSKLLEQHRIIATAYYWLNEPHLRDVKDSQQFITPYQEFLGNLHNNSQVLAVWKSTMVKIQADLDVHRSAIKEFLSSLSSSSGEIYKEILEFDNAIAASNQRYIFFLSLAISLTEYSAVLLQFEVSGGDEPFESLVKQFNEERSKLQSSENSITAVERNLVQLLDPENKIDQCWIENITELLDEMIFAVQKKICDLEKERTSMENVLQGDGQKIQFILDSSIRLDLRQLLKMITKSCKQISKMDNSDLFQDIRDIQQTMKILQGKLNELQEHLFSREFETILLVQLLDKIDELCTLCHSNNDSLDLLIERFIQMDTEHGQQRRIDSPKRTEHFNKDVAVINSQLGEQKRNAYAVSVWKRIRMKLEGRDPDPNRRSSVAEQVDYVISEATNEDNLASLYEGWTPWV